MLSLINLIEGYENDSYYLKIRVGEQPVRRLRSMRHRLTELVLTRLFTGSVGRAEIQQGKDSIHDKESQSVNEYGGSLVEKAGEKSSAFSLSILRGQNMSDSNKNKDSA